MVNVQARMRKLKAKLFDIRFGPGAALLPHNVKRIHLDFATKMNLGHFGARKFWHNYLPRLKYHNPAVSMTVNRRTDQEGPATLTVFFAPPLSATSASSSPADLPSIVVTNSSPSTHHPVEREESIDVKHIRDTEIYSLLMGLAKATPVVPTAEEEAELRQLKEDLEQSKQDSIIGAKYRAKMKEEKALLDLARGAAPA